MKTCDMLVGNFKRCGKPATKAKHLIVHSIIKGNPHQFSPPDEYFCDEHVKYVSGAPSDPRIEKIITDL